MSVATMTRRMYFDNPMTNKPANLQNTAVLRMLEEEENRRKNGQLASLKRVAWPPNYNELGENIEENTFQSQGVEPSQVVAQNYNPPSKSNEPPPVTITLRPNVPISQVPPPLVTSQPATATLRGGKHLRGDLKWPPENVRERMAAEQQHLMELAKGPACKPRKQQKDYSSFFAKHALNNSYPGYKIPPGTQFYDHNPVM